MVLTMAAITLMPLLVTLLAAPATAAAAPVRRCPTSCGLIDFSYPFGVGPRCSLPGFNLTCDANGRLLEGALADAGGVRLDRVARAPGAPSGHAVVMLMPDGQNSIIIVGGANMEGWAPEVDPEDLDLIRQAGVLLLQREIPDWVNIQVAQVVALALSAYIPTFEVTLD